MALWLVLTAMTSVAAVLVAAPFLRDWDRRPECRARDVFREQLADIERECARGDIDAASAREAATEIRRRLLSARATDDLPMLSAKERAVAAIGVAGIVVLGAVGLFAITGGQTPAGRSDVAGEAPRMEARTPPVEAHTPPVSEMIDRLERRLQAESRDITGWRTLGWARLQTDAYRGAAEAYAKAIELQPDAADNYSARAEALIKAGGGRVQEEARVMIDAALARDGKDARARYWLGVAQKQNGEKEAARETWRSMLADGLEKDVATDVEMEIAALDGNAPPKTTNDSSDMIGSMVDGLEQRLETAPKDSEGWIRLVRSRMVLGETEKARSALTRALDAFSGDPEARRRIEDAAKQAGL